MPSNSCYFAALSAAHAIPCLKMLKAALTALSAQVALDSEESSLEDRGSFAAVRLSHGKAITNTSAALKTLKSSTQRRNELT